MEEAGPDEIEYSECSTSDLIDDGEVEYCGGSDTSTSSAVERRGLKREFGDGDGAAAVAVVPPERRLRSRLQERFALLRAAVPNLRTDERASILAGAYEYIERLQRQEAELLCELEEDDSETSCCEDDEVSCSSCKEVADEERTVESGSGAAGSDCGSCCSVEVVRTVIGLRIRIECGTRPGLLLAVMELLESHNLSVEEASVDCVERLIFNGIGLEEVNGETRVSAEVLRASLRSLICRPGQRQGTSATVE